MAGKSESPLLKAVLPVLEREVIKEYERLTGIFRKIITAKNEDAAFFRSPSAYLKKQGVLTVDTIRLPNGKQVPVIQDKVVIETVRRARELVAGGGLTRVDIDLGLPCGTPWRRVRILPFFPRYSLPWRLVLPYSFVYGIGDNRLVINEKTIGPLVDPAVFLQIKRAQTAELKAQGVRATAAVKSAAKKSTAAKKSAKRSTKPATKK